MWARRKWIRSMEKRWLFSAENYNDAHECAAKHTTVRIQWKWSGKHRMSKRQKVPINESPFNVCGRCCCHNPWRRVPNSEFIYTQWMWSCAGLWPGRRPTMRSHSRTDATGRIDVWRAIVAKVIRSMDGPDKFTELSNTVFFRFVRCSCLDTNSVQHPRLYVCLCTHCVCVCIHPLSEDTQAHSLR